MKFHGVPEHDIDPIDVNLARIIGDTLEKHYPGWGWMVNVDSEGGVVNIINGVMNTSLQKQYGYVLMMTQVSNTYDMIIKETVMAGGELLERMNLPRSRWKGEEPKKVEGARPQDQPFPSLN